MLLNSRGDKEKKKKKALLSVVLRHMREDSAQIIYNIFQGINYV